MIRFIEWSPRAKDELHETVNYLLQNWSEKTADMFLIRLDKLIDTIKRNPEAYPKTAARLGVRRCVVSKQNSLYYRVDEEKLVILTIFDSRQDPRKLKL